METIAFAFVRGGVGPLFFLANYGVGYILRVVEYPTAFFTRLPAEVVVYLSAELAQQALNAIAFDSGE